METPPAPRAPAAVLGHPPSAAASPELGGPLLWVTLCPRPPGLSLAPSPLQPPPGFSCPGMRCPEPALLQAGQCQLSQPLLMAETLQSLHQLHGPVLDSVQSVPVSRPGQPSSGPSTPGLPHCCGAEGKDPLPLPAVTQLPVQPRTLFCIAAGAHCCPMGILVSSRTLPIFTFPTGWPPAVTAACGCSLPRTGLSTCH